MPSCCGPTFTPEARANSIASDSSCPATCKRSVRRDRYSVAMAASASLRARSSLSTAASVRFRRATFARSRPRNVIVPEVRFFCDAIAFSSNFSIGVSSRSSTRCSRAASKDCSSSLVSILEAISETSTRTVTSMDESPFEVVGTLRSLFAAGSSLGSDAARRRRCKAKSCCLCNLAASCNVSVACSTALRGTPASFALSKAASRAGTSTCRTLRFPRVTCLSACSASERRCSAAT
mmetsp:Transcript_47157/g.123729  ORF Transcript_47157/g.123729 Transcript_47157/m.123729 type:complete len:236 (+) Transcript_47157:1257-1964(+)